jgi:hypothetical protein
MIATMFLLHDHEDVSIGANRNSTEVMSKEKPQQHSPAQLGRQKPRILTDAADHGG